MIQNKSKEEFEKKNFWRNESQNVPNRAKNSAISPPLENFAHQKINYAKFSKQILMIIAQENYRDEEYDIPKKIFTQAGFMVVTASQSVGKAVGKLGGSTQATLSISDVDVKGYDAIVFVGGSGSALFQHNAMIHAIAQEAVKQEKILASICLAGAILACAGVLNGKKATVWNKDGKQQPIFEEHGAIYVSESVVVDGRIITADGPGAAEQFAKKIIEVLGKK